MREYRFARQEDADGIKALCDKHMIRLPKGKVFVCVVDDKIVGFIGIEAMAFIEPLISEDHMATHDLIQRAEAFCQTTGIQEVYCMTEKNSPLEDLWSKTGFQTTETNKIIMKKEIP